jgi:hypothetical protein
MFWGRAGQSMKDGIRCVTSQKSESPTFYIVQHQGTSLKMLKEFLLEKLKPLIKGITKSQRLHHPAAAIAQSV